jgi:hypothetical protein
MNTDSIRFELFEMMRKLTMTSVLVFVASGGLGQILVGLIVHPPLPVTERACSVLTTNWSDSAISPG